MHIRYILDNIGLKNNCDCIKAKDSQIQLIGELHKK